MNLAQNRTRIRQTNESYIYLRDRINRWFSDRKRADPLRQYVSQLNVLSQKLDQTLEKLSVQVSGLSPMQSRGEIYRACSAYDQYLLWVQRIWEYYRFRFDQRDQNDLHNVLAAADEIVWSTFHGMFPDPLPGAPADAPYRPAPLAYIAPEYSPQAVDRPSAEIQGIVDMPEEFQKKLDAYLKNLPIPTVSLPQFCVQFPWWLVLLGHEVGHHVQREASVIQSFANLLRTAASGVVDPQLGQTDFADRWSSWSSEIFADVFSVLMLGPSAYWAMMELDSGNDVTMLSPRRGRYPAPVIRLLLMRGLLEKLGLDADEYAALNQRDLDLQIDIVLSGTREVKLQDDAKLDRSALLVIVEAIHSQAIPPLGQLTSACEWNAAKFQPGGAVQGWAKLLRQSSEIEPEPTLEAAREIISGAALAWQQISMLADDVQRDESEKALTEKMLPLLIKSREPKTRAATISAPGTTNISEEDMADILVANIPVS